MGDQRQATPSTARTGIFDTEASAVFVLGHQHAAVPTSDAVLGAALVAHWCGACWLPSCNFFKKEKKVQTKVLAVNAAGMTRRAQVHAEAARNVERARRCARVIGTLHCADKKTQRGQAK